MKKYINIILTTVVLGFGALLTANAQSNRDFRPDFDYYDEEFDWRWDVRVRISDGINSGLITRWEANRLYRRLERIEEKEYAYAADGFYDAWEQDDVWRDVQRLHSLVGLELRDFDRTFYGFNPIGIAFTGYPSWWYYGGYNFYRFDHWGWGSIRRGYAAQCFVPLWVPNRVVYVNNFHNYGHRYYRNANRNEVVRYDSHSNSNRTDVTRRSRTSGRNDRTVYNRNGDNARRETAVTPNSRSRSSSVDRSATRRSETLGSRSETPNRSTARTRTNTGRSESMNRTSGADSRSREFNRPTTRSSDASTSRSRTETPSRSVAPSRSSSREVSRPATSSRSSSVTPNRSSSRSTSSVNRSSRSSSSSSSMSRSSRSSSSSNRSEVSRSSAGRTKAPATSRSSSSRRNN